MRLVGHARECSNYSGRIDNNSSLAVGTFRVRLNRSRPMQNTLWMCEDSRYGRSRNVRARRSEGDEDGK